MERHEHSCSKGTRHVQEKEDDHIYNETLKAVLVISSEYLICVENWFSLSIREKWLRFLLSRFALFVNLSN